MDIEFLNKIFNREFIKDLLKNGAEVYLVGGVVRDMFLNKKPKDIDLVCRLIPFQQFSDILSKYGKVDLVGESFGVIKFKEFGTNEEYEIALPRSDQSDKTKKGRRAIIAQSDEKLPIENDLRRRDLTINSVAISHDYKIIDPFDGLMDLARKIIRATDEYAFVDDPLRMLRALGFASRFGFSIDQKTFNQIKSNAFLIKDISGERILMEFQKVVEKQGDHIIFLELLCDTGLWKEFFGFEMSGKIENFIPTTLSELLYYTVNDDYIDSTCLWSIIFENKLKIDIKTKKELDALQNLAKVKSIYSKDQYNNYIGRQLIFNCLRSCPWALTLPLFHLNGLEKDFIIGKYPKSLKDVKFTGDDLIEMGYSEGKEMGQMLNDIVKNILTDKLSNERECIKKYVIDEKKKLKV